MLGVGCWVLGVGTENRKLKTNNRVPSCEKKSYHPSQGNSGRSKTRPLNSIVLVFRFAPNRASNRPTDILHKNGIAIYRIIRINAEQVRPSARPIHFRQGFPYCGIENGDKRFYFQIARRYMDERIYHGQKPFRTFDVHAENRCLDFKIFFG